MTRETQRQHKETPITLTMRSHKNSRNRFSNEIKLFTKIKESLPKRSKHSKKSKKNKSSKRKLKQKFY